MQPLLSDHTAERRLQPSQHTGPNPCTRVGLTFSPVLVLQVRPSLLAWTAAVTVVPLLPPQPTSISPRRGTRLSVRNVTSVVQGVTYVRNRELSLRRCMCMHAHLDGVGKVLKGYRDIVLLRVHGGGLVGITSRDVRICVLHIRAVDMNVNRHSRRFYKRPKKNPKQNIKHQRFGKAVSL